MLQPAIQMRSGRSSGWLRISSGMIFFARISNTSGSRKKLVTLISRSLARRSISFASLRSNSRYLIMSFVSIDDMAMRRSIRRCSVPFLYSVKSWTVLVRKRSMISDSQPGSVSLAGRHPASDPRKSAACG